MHDGSEWCGTGRRLACVLPHPVSGSEEAVHQGSQTVQVGVLGGQRRPVVRDLCQAGLMNSSRQLGGCIGLAALATIAAHRTGTATTPPRSTTATPWAWPSPPPSSCWRRSWRSVYRPGSWQLATFHVETDADVHADHWEMHPEAEEAVCCLTGGVRLYFRPAGHGDAEDMVQLRAGTRLESRTATR